MPLCLKIVLSTAYTSTQKGHTSEKISLDFVNPEQLLINDQGYQWADSIYKELSRSKQPNQYVASVKTNLSGFDN